MIKTYSKTISILPDRSLMPKIGQTGYSISEAMAELVDNSVDARILGKVLTVEIRMDVDADLIEVRDDGFGMDEKTAATCIKLAYSTKKDQLGEFGLGLKSAATSLGKSFQITTTPKGSDVEYRLGFNEKEWLEKGNWNKYPMEIRKGVPKRKSGTSVRISGLKIKLHPNLPGNVRRDLASRFAPFIQNGELRIRVNTKWCEPAPLELQLEYHQPDGKEPFDFTLESGQRVYGWRGLLRKGSDGEKYGFRVFRRGRLITQYAKLGFKAHPEARQIIGELHLDKVPVTHNKREFMQESPLYKELNEENGIFWNFMRDLVREARSSVRKTSIDQLVIDQMHRQMDNIMKAIKTLPELKEFAFPDLAEKVRSTKNKYDGISEIEIEKRDQRELVAVEEQTPPKEEHTRQPKKVQPTKQYYITIHGKKFKFEHHFRDLKTEDVLKDKEIDTEAGIVVYTNIAFPAYGISKDPVFYGTWNIAESIAEVMVEENNRAFNEVYRIRDMILQKSSVITRDMYEMEAAQKEAIKKQKELEKINNRISSMTESLFR